MRKSPYMLATAAAMAVSLALAGVAHAGDVEIVNPNTTQPAPAAPPPAVVPVETPAPVVAPPQRVIHEDVQPPRNVMSTIAVSALMGGLAGLLVGGAIFYLNDHQDHAARIGIWAAGGVLVGTGVGIIQVAADESRANAAVSQLWSPDPAHTYRVALFQERF
jgi:hypothetical protein